MPEQAPAVLVGTSCTEALIPVVAALRPVAQLVFICAAIALPGRSLLDQIATDGVLQPAWRSYRGNPVSRQAAARFMFNDCEGAGLTESLTTVRLFMPRRLYEGPCPLRQLPAVPSVYIGGTRDQIIRPSWVLSAPQRVLGVAPIMLDTGHCPQNSSPSALASVLLRKLLPDDDGRSSGCSSAEA